MTDMVHFPPSDEHRFGGADPEGKTHVFTYAKFDQWCKSYVSAPSISAECGVTFRPQFMGRMEVGANLCVACKVSCYEFILPSVEHGS